MSVIVHAYQKCYTCKHGADGWRDDDELIISQTGMGAAAINHDIKLNYYPAILSSVDRVTPNPTTRLDMCCTFGKLHIILMPLIIETGFV